MLREDKPIKLISICIVSILTLLLAEIVLAGQKVYFYHTVAAGTPVAMTDASGNVVWQADYKPFGEEQSVAGSIENNERFTGKEKDEETGLYYFGARYMGAGIGRFVSVDPAGIAEKDLLNPQRLNRYNYSLNNPYKYVDPDGKAAILQAAKFYEVRQSVLGWAPSWLQEIIMPSDPIIGPTAIESEGGKLSRGLSKVGERTISEKISKGHAFEKHIGEFKDLGIQSREQFSDLVSRIMKNASGDNVRQLSGGRTGYWDDATGTVVIHNPSAKDAGTAFRPTTGKKYFTDDLK